MTLIERVWGLLSLSALVFFVSGCSNSSQNETPHGSILSVSTVGGSNNERGSSVITTTDQGYAILGYTQSNDGDVTDKTDTSFDYWVVKYKADHTIEWQKTYGGSGNDRGRSIIQTLDGGYALIGSSSSTDGDVSNNSGQLDFWMVKLDSSGNISWENSFGFPGNDEGISLIQTSDLGYLLIGVLDVTGSGGEGNTRASSRHAGGDYWAVKLSASGELEWSRYFGGNFTDTPEGVVQLPDEGYIIAGGSDSEDTDISNNIGTYDFWVIRISSDGDLIWERSFGGTQIDEARAIVASNDGNYLIVGDTRSNDVMVSSNNGAADVWLIKITPSGNLIWEKNYGGSGFDTAQDIVKLNDGYVITGSSRSADGDVAVNKGQNDLWVFKIDFEGNLIWEQSVGGSNIDFGYGVTFLNNGTVVSVGDTGSTDGDITENKGFTDLLLAIIND